MDEDNSVITETQLRIAPAIIPLLIIGTVIRKKVFGFEVPRLIAASSILSGICCNVATLLRIVYGIRRIHIAMIMIAAVPVQVSQPDLKLTINAIPTTEPGIIYGSMDTVSMALFRKLFRRTTRYAISIANKTITINVVTPMKIVLKIVLFMRANAFS